MRVLILLAGEYNYAIPKLFVESGWEVLLFEEGKAGGATNGAVELLGEWRTRTHDIDLIVTNRPSLLFKYHEAAGDSVAPVLYMEDIHHRHRVGRLVRGISPMEQDLILALIYPKDTSIPIPVESADCAKVERRVGSRRRWWRRLRG